MTRIRRVLGPIVQLRDEESATAVLMFAFSFCAMTGYNMIKPATRSKFIYALGAENLPWVLLAAGFLIGVLMGGYTWLVTRLPRRWAVPIMQAGMAGLMLLFFFLFQTGAEWVSVAFYLYGLILAVLLTSQFWTLANVIYDPRQAKRLFGFIGGGAPLGGMAGSAVAAYAKTIGTNNLLLISTFFLAATALVVSIIMARERSAAAATTASAQEEKGVSFQEAVQLLRQSKHLKIIAVVISFAAIGAGVIEQQLNMATEAAKGQGATDNITEFLARVQLGMSFIGFVIQVWLTSRIHKFLGIGFALLVLPVAFATSAALMLAFAALWTTALARVADQSLRYTVDKTTREVLFLPLPGDLKYKAKPFVDVTVDRMAKAVAALLLLVLVQPWGFALQWHQVSYASLVIVILWIVMAYRARKGYLRAFRDSIERQDVRPAELRLDVGDPTTIETLIEELSSPDERRVLYAIDMLESLDKRRLITPLLLYHEAPAIRARVLATLTTTTDEAAVERWLTPVQRMLKDSNGEVRSAAVVALANLRNEQATKLVRPYLKDRDPRIAATAAIILARSDDAEDVEAAEAALTRLASDPRDAAAEQRRNLAVAIRQIPDPRFRHLLIPLLYDSDPQVAEEAMHSVRELGTSDFLFLPALVSLLRNRRMKSAAREVLVGYGEEVLDALNHFLRDPDEDPWVRRHLPATIALIPSQKSMDILVGALAEPDGFLRYKVVTAIEKLRRDHPDLKFNAEPIEKLTLNEGRRYYAYLSLRHNLANEAAARGSLLVAALTEKIGRTTDRVYRLLGLIYPWKDVAAARWAIEHGDTRARSSGVEYLDNLLAGQLRKRLLPMLDDIPVDEKVRQGNVMLKTRRRDIEDTLLHLIHDDDPVVAASAIAYVRDHKVWSLASDLEHAASHRASDPYVAEAASWALAFQRAGTEPPAGSESLPTVALAHRMRQIPMFSGIWVDELFRLASTGRQTLHESARMLYTEGQVPDQAHLLLEGRVHLQSRSGESRDVEPPTLLGFEAVLEGSPMRETARAATRSISLVLSAEDTRTMLADNTDLVEGLMRILVERDPEERTQLVLRGNAAQVSERLAAGGVTPIERALALETVPVLSGVSADQMLHFAAITREAPLSAGTPLFNESDRPALYIILRGEVSLRSPSDTPTHAGPSDAIGLYQTLAGLPLGRDALVTSPGVALRIDRDDLFDLLGQRPELLQQLFTALSEKSAKTSV
jgi:AAA family ATP:ADP antiporter